MTDAWLEYKRERNRNYMRAKRNGTWVATRAPKRRLAVARERMARNRRAEKELYLQALAVGLAVMAASGVLKCG